MKGMVPIFGSALLAELASLWSRNVGSAQVVPCLVGWLLDGWCWGEETTIKYALDESKQRGTLTMPERAPEAPH